MIGLGRKCKQKQPMLEGSEVDKGWQNEKLRIAAVSRAQMQLERQE